jgi:hypothetical protein
MGKESKKRGVVTWGQGVIPLKPGRFECVPDDESIARIFGKHEIPAPVSSFKRAKEGSK